MRSSCTRLVPRSWGTRPAIWLFRGLLFSVVSVAFTSSGACSSSVSPSGDGAVVDTGTNSPLDASDSDIGDAVAVGDCTPDMTRTESCGACGQRLDTCSSAGTWMVGDCVEGGLCFPGEVDVRIGYVLGEPACGRDERLCSSACTWGDWSVVRPGYPAPGESSAIYYLEQDQYAFRPPCADQTAVISRDDPLTCQELRSPYVFDDEGVEIVGYNCNRGCPGAPRDGGDETEREICVPAGAYQWGPRPNHQVIATEAYYIDRHAVSRARYQRCVDSGECTALTPKLYNGVMLDDDPSLVTGLPQGADFIVITATFDQARTFCAWDGGRELPSGIQWEKSLRYTNPSVDPEDLGAYQWEWPKSGPYHGNPCTTRFPNCTSPNPLLSVQRVWGVIDNFAKSAVYGVDDFFHFYEYTRSWYPDPPYEYPGETTRYKPEYPPFGRRIQMRGMSEQEPLLDATSGFSRITPDIGFGAFRCSRWAH